MKMTFDHPSHLSLLCPLNMEVRLTNRVPIPRLSEDGNGQGFLQNPLALLFTNSKIVEPPNEATFAQSTWGQLGRGLFFKHEIQR